MQVSPDNSQITTSPQETLPIQPLEKNKRIDALDILRGLCLVGILLMNIEWFNRAIISLGGQDTSLTGVDHTVGWLIRCFVEGKFYKLFALIFGMGFAVMLMRAKEMDRPFGAWFSRRMFVLLLIGIAHMIFIWGGDILHDYAFAGFILLLLVRKKKSQEPKSYLKLGLTWLIVPIFLTSLAGIIFGTVFNDAKFQEMWKSELDIYTLVEQKFSSKSEMDSTTSTEITNETTIKPAEETEHVELTDEEITAETIATAIQDRLDAQADIDKENKAFTEGSYWEATQYRISFSGVMLMFSPLITLAVLIPIFILGFWLVISKTITQHQQHQTFFKTLARVGLLAGIPLNVASLLIIQHPAASISFVLLGAGEILFYIAQLTLAAGYLGLVVCALNKQKWQRILSVFAPMGQMALTNYLMHSVILTSVFYGYAGGQYGEISRAPQMLLVFGIITGQLVFFFFFLSHYRFGPMEWLWRSLTYKKIQPMKL